MGFEKYRLSCLLFLLLLSTVLSRVPKTCSSHVIARRAYDKPGHGLIDYAFVAKFGKDICSPLVVRGGSDDSEDEDEEDGDEEEGADGALDLTSVLESAADITQSTIIPLTKKAVIATYNFTKKAVIATVKAIQRAIQAGMEGEEEAQEQEEDEEVSVVQKMVATIQRMVKAAFTFPQEEEEDDDKIEQEEDNDETPTNDAADDEESTEESTEEDMKQQSSAKESTIPTGQKSPSTPKTSDFGTFLATSYGVEDSRTSERGALVLGGSLAAALQEARAQARLLVIFLPAEKPSKKKGESKESIAIESILSQEVGEAANQRARSKGEDTGSFLFWGARVGSSEASAAIKRLKVKPKSSKEGKIPTLMVVYPAMVSESARCFLATIGSVF